MATGCEVALADLREGPVGLPATYFFEPNPKPVWPKRRYIFFHEEKQLDRLEVGLHLEVIRKKGKLHDLVTDNKRQDKMLFAAKRSDYFYASKAKRTFHAG